MTDNPGIQKLAGRGSFRRTWAEDRTYVIAHYADSAAVLTDMIIRGLERADVPPSAERIAELIQCARAVRERTDLIYEAAEALAVELIAGGA